MIACTDGPAKGRLLYVDRAPSLLRVVVDLNRHCWALDDLRDRPTAAETCYVYILDEKLAVETGLTASYRLFELQPEQNVCKDPARFKAWASDMANGPGRPLDAKPGEPTQPGWKPWAKKSLDEPPPHR